jgi:fido (protein-threonine AMPylation protein)/biotin operon repressor
MVKITYDEVPSPDSGRRLENWNTAIGLQAVDGLEPSDKLLELARGHIEGESEIEDVEYQLKAYYADLSARGVTSPVRQIEADIVSTNIERLLETDAFVLSENSFKLIHQSLFKGFDEYSPGEYRSYDFTKSEWVLNGDSVNYGHWEFLREEIPSLIRSEKALSYGHLNEVELIGRIIDFTSELWLYHAFREGNTRTVALFIIKYLRSIGYQLNNAPFEQYSLYFRNALVRANYRNDRIAVLPTRSYLSLFFNAVVSGEMVELKNRRLHIYWNEERQDFSNHDERGVVLKNSNDAEVRETVNETVNETTNETVKLILGLMRGNPAITYDEIAASTGKSRATVHRMIAELKTKGIIKRSGASKNGRWIVIDSTQTRQ